MAEKFDHENLPEVKELSYEEGVALLDEQAQINLGISGEDFLRAYDAGEITLSHDDPRHSQIVRVAILLPLVR